MFVIKTVRPQSVYMWWFSRAFGPQFGLKIGGGGEEDSRAPLPRIRHWCYPTFPQLGPDLDCSEKKKRGFFFGKQSEKSNIKHRGCCNWKLKVLWNLYRWVFDCNFLPQHRVQWQSCRFCAALPLSNHKAQNHVKVENNECATVLFCRLQKPWGNNILLTLMWCESLQESLPNQIRVSLLFHFILP